MRTGWSRIMGGVVVSAVAALVVVVAVQAGGPPSLDWSPSTGGSFDYGLTGVGKTATCFHLSGALAKMGRRVLLIDCDPQANLSEGLLGVAHNLSIEAMFKTGKTTLIGSAMGSLADGTSFLGFAPVHPPAGPVGVWNCEMDPDDFDDYLAPHVTDASRVVTCALAMPSSRLST